jgi:hypothetical protein
MSFARLVETHPEVAQETFEKIDDGLNQLLPNSTFHNRYRDAAEVGLALVVGHRRGRQYNPLIDPPVEAAFMADNRLQHPDAWEGEIDQEFLRGYRTTVPRFTFFALAKTENMRLTRQNSSYDPEHCAKTPGVVGFAGGISFFDSFVTTSGLWEVHDHIVTGVFASEVNGVAAHLKTPRTADEFAELFERRFVAVKQLHEGQEAADIPHMEVGRLIVGATAA